MTMELEELGCAYEGAVRQIDILDLCLTELHHRRDATELMDQEHPEFGYLGFKIDIVSSVKHMYEEFRDLKWTQLQKECARSLHEVLYQQATDSAHLDERTPTGRSLEEEFNLLVHQIPVPLTPIDDDRDSEGDDLRVPQYRMWGSEDMEVDGFSRD